MNLLLDTHVLLWWFDNNPKLSLNARQAIANPNNLVFVSAVTAWEITIKTALGKLTAPTNLEEAIVNNSFQPLPITIPHALAVASLPPIHQDPFDRLLAAQTLVESLTLITADPYLLKYPLPFIPA